ncbi:MULTISPECIES: aminoacyl-tRNA hydrolase [Pseudothermotoga]|uniref:Peptidyl-tRNA hydrolase n=1 Tax=Pseudothermotoga lettingae (strain ATCC BAA-301 / DSM 14385 / NBRC 107922 / TMO) TaxID=416591 RepID=PTH_PSELT|nr:MULTISPECIES: aminoacyl-tRNA hydrolase [Pseudothermotoga]A8F4D7.1 RecName: Full=Peptidyl-tRNA hydrolase; Short=PTH [Pseudothermotoga lettingae TMO]ABV33021.1 Aminoacyl-tRNA hydrolase [Pseudothermotoga lettingae TMO]KUK22079.1 MAG: Peptidyl-tRNA hydrolase [Pseudothermotoga lettingae]MDI3494199.1 peptidyl-tRNA hydrolase, family [Pseudothermotoga sp.]MDK2884027.1 peptidyl-tRNA hydrolase, family [Pseudothermotoga sp.]GLI47977.1 peptidyl-tRNA hydrolase [Pseudothermotoga lettingae TMO]
MKVIVGLGNPGPRYAFNRHNVGFMFVDRFKEFKKCSTWQHRDRYTFSQCKDIFLVKPNTFMNLSGIAVIKCQRDFHVTTTDIIVVYDDVDLPCGRLRIKAQGGSGGHRGLQSIIDYIGTNEFVRLRIGIGPKPENIDLADYVLEDFTEEELRLIDKVLDKAVEAVDVMLNEGLSKAMSVFNSYEVVL